MGMVNLVFLSLLRMMLWWVSNESCFFLYSVSVLGVKQVSVVSCVGVDGQIYRFCVSCLIIGIMLFGIII